MILSKKMILEDYSDDSKKEVEREETGQKRKSLIISEGKKVV